MATYTNRILFFGVVCLLVQGARSFAQEVGRTPAEASAIEMRVSALDAGLRPLPDSRFVKGESIVVELMLLNCAEADRREQTERDAVKRMRRAERGEPEEPQTPAPPTPATPVALSVGGEAWCSHVQFSLRTPDGQEVLMDKGRPLVPTWKPEFLQRGPAVQSLVLETTECWMLDSSLLAAGRYRLAVQLRLPAQKSDPAALLSAEGASEFTVIDRSSARPEELARVSLREAQAEDRAGKPDAVLAAAQAALQFGPDDPYDLATLHELIGKACEAKGALEAAIASYEQAKQIAETKMPGRTHLPAIMEARIEELRERTNKK